LLWEDCAFPLLNELRRLTPSEPRSALTSSLVAEAIDNNYVQTMILGVSRLTDPQPADPSKGGVSLRRVFNDVQDHRHLITREAFICYDGMKFDPSTIPWPQEFSVKGGPTGTQIGGPLDRSTPLYLHNRFDRLSGTDAGHRTRFDRVNATIFAEINALLSRPAINRIRSMRNKFIAHASDTRSRGRQSGPILSIANVEHALRPLVQAYHRLASDVLWGMGSGGALMPTPQFDPMEGLVDALTSEQKEHLPTFWDELVETHNRWHEEPT
jgi:hypothetical protein